MQNLGTIIALVGAALAALMAGIGSVRGVSTAGEAAAGIVSENPDVFGKVLVLQALPGTQGIYGLLVAFLIMNKIGILGGGVSDVSVTTGLLILAAFPLLAHELFAFFPETGRKQD